MGRDSRSPLASRQNRPRGAYQRSEGFSVRTTANCTKLGPLFFSAARCPIGRERARRQGTLRSGLRPSTATAARSLSLHAAPPRRGRLTPSIGPSRPSPSGGLRRALTDRLREQGFLLGGAAGG